MQMQKMPQCDQTFNIHWKTYTHWTAAFLIILLYLIYDFIFRLCELASLTVALDILS